MTDVLATARRQLQAPNAPLFALGAVALAAATLALLALLFPETFYYPIIWQYYYGPIVSDYAGGPLTRGGVTAYPGYNLVDTITWGVILGVALWNLLTYFQRRGYELTRTLTYALLPMIAAGGTMRGLIEVNWLPPPWAYLFITPNIYFMFFFYTIGALLVGLEVERRQVRPGFRIRHWHVVAAAGALAWLVTLLGVASFAVDAPAGAVRWLALLEVFGYSALLTGALVAILWVPGFQFVRDPLYVLVLYGQIVDGMQNYIGVTRGFASKLMGTNFLHGVLGDHGLLVGKIILFVPMLAYLKAKVEPDGETSRNQLMLILIAILALGLAMGFHGGVELILD